MKKSKGLSFIALSVFAILFAVSFVSAAITIFPNDHSVSITQGQSSSFNFKIYNNGGTGGACVGNCTLVNISATPSDLASSSSTIASSYISIGTLPNSIANQTNSSNISVSIDVPSAQEVGTYTGTITISGEHNETEGTVNSKIINLTVTVTAAPVLEEHFCDYGQVNESNMQLDVRIRNYGQGFDNSWNPLDKIKVQVKLKNDFATYDLSDVMFEIGLFKKGTNTNVIDDMAWISADNELYSYGYIDVNERGDHTFEFKVDPYYLDSGNYVLKVKAYQDLDEDMYCIDSSTNFKDFGSEDYFADIRIQKQSDRDKMVVVDDTETISLNAQCGESVSFPIDVWNVGNKDYRDQIMVSLYNQELGIDQNQIYLNDLYAGDNAKLYFDFKVPENASEKVYPLYMRTYYDYDENAGSYKEDYDRMSDEVFTAYLDVNGNCVPPADEIPQFSVNYETEARAGEELVVRVTITNPSDSTMEYLVNAAGYTAWANTAVLDTTSPFELAGGQSKDVLITFDVKEDVSGEQLFNVELVSEGQLAASQPVQVYLEESKKLSFLTGSAISENSTAYALGLLNIILVIIIIIVAIRVARK